MGVSSVREMPVFVDTNLGTRIVIAIPPDTTASNFKREFCEAHLNCFPELGVIRVLRLKVKKKSCYYNLSESVPLKHAFQGSKGWFLHLEVYRLQDQSGYSESIAVETCNHASDFRDITTAAEVQQFAETTNKNSKRSKRKKKMKRFFSIKAALLEGPRAIYFLKKRKKKCNRNKRNIAAKNSTNQLEQGHDLAEDRFSHFACRLRAKGAKEGDICSRNDCPSETFSEAVSVSGIIRRYFMDDDEVTSNSGFSFAAVRRKHYEHSFGQIDGNCQNTQHGISTPPIAETPVQTSHSLALDVQNSQASRGAHKKNVGTKILAASDNLGLSISKQRGTLSLCKFIDGRSVALRSTPLVRSLVFENTDEDD